MTSEPYRRSVPAGRPPGPRPRVVDQAVLETGGVFVGRFKSKLGHYQDGRPERPPPHAAALTGKCVALSPLGGSRTGASAPYSPEW